MYIKSYYYCLFLVTSSSSFSPSDKSHRRTPSGGTPLDRPGAPPPLPPPVIVVPSPTVQMRQRHSVPLPNINTNEQENSSSTDEKSVEIDTSTDQSTIPTPSNDGVNVTKLISELNTRMAAAKINNNAQTTNIRASSIRNSTSTTPGETTDF
jgi:hypothetical protein